MIRDWKMKAETRSEKRGTYQSSDGMARGATPISKSVYIVVINHRRQLYFWQGSSHGKTPVSTWKKYERNFHVGERMGMNCHSHADRRPDYDKFSTCFTQEHGKLCGYRSEIITGRMFHNNREAMFNMLKIRWSTLPSQCGYSHLRRDTYSSEKEADDRWYGEDIKY
ncbi:hypothetical protein TELCIR_09656 [Teladorsagia circumcincta]|uniref:Uncharacterized protein n=1 Tax=Teladorsagia circumcincta TaxID=45464 RepID=A0A2G9UE69_TELCI|nr:hypothetical protein TELCIR_09656 [Teladorsagia circumcincta]